MRYEIESIKFKPYAEPVGITSKENLIHDLENYIFERCINEECPIKVLAKENEALEERVWELETLKGLQDARDKVETNLEAILDGKKLEGLTKKDLRSILEDALDTLRAA